VRGNGKVIQELEAFFRGAGWNVIKVIWGRDWDPLLAQDTDGVLVNKMNTTPDGQFQTYSVESGAYIRENFFGGDPRLRKMVEHLSDDELRGLSRAGTTTARCTRRSRRRGSTPASPRSSWRTPSRAGRWARTSRRATPPTR
jgi:Pyruvate dehydrogenase complex, dehydrogenase (E1) component